MGEMDGKMKNERAGILRRQEESLPLWSQTENKDRWERDGRKKWETQGPKVIKEQYQSLHSCVPWTQSIQLCTCPLMRYPSILSPSVFSFYYFYTSSVLSLSPLSLHPLFSFLWVSTSNRKWVKESDGWIKKESTTPCRLHSSPVLTLNTHTFTKTHTLLPVTSYSVSCTKCYLLQFRAKNTLL